MSVPYQATSPAGVVVRFLGKMCDLGSPPTDHPSYYEKRIAYEDCSFADPDATYSYFPGNKVFFDQAPAIYSDQSPDDPPTNQEDLDALALALAEDYYRWTSLWFDVSFAGVLVCSTSAAVEELIIDYQEDGCLTRILTGPPTGESEQMLHWDPAAGACANKSVLWQEVYGPRAVCANGHLSIPVFVLGYVNGRLMKRYVRTDTVS